MPRLAGPVFTIGPMARLPPLAAVRAFEAAARHLSFTKAAEELFVTQSAVSRHIRHLEEWLGTRLFERRHRTLELTAEGEQYRFEIASVFRRLASATERIVRASDGRENLNIHSYTTFAMSWLIPRIANFQKAHPGIELRLTAATRPLGSDREQVHGVISLGPGPFEAAVRLFPVVLIPVCTPAYMQQHLGSRSAAELSRVTLLHSIAAEHNWEIWTQLCGFPEVDLGAGLRFDSSAMAYVAASRGMGVAMAQMEFVREDLAEGRLVAPFPTAVVAKRAYYFSMADRGARSQALARFRDWLLTEVESQPALPAEIGGSPLRVLSEN